MDGRGKKGKGKRKRQKAKRSRATTRRLRNLSRLLLFLGVCSSFFVRSCKVFLAGILPRDPAGAPRLGLARNSPVSYPPLRCFVFRRPSLTYTLVVLPLSTCLPPTRVLSSPLAATYRCLRCSDIAAAATATVTAAAAAGGGAFPNFETLTKSRAR